MRKSYIKKSTKAFVSLLLCLAPIVSSAQRLEQLTNSDATQQLSEVASLGSSIVFPAVSTSNGTELFVSGGTQQTTGQLLDITAGRASSVPHNFYPFRQSLLFVAEGELWSTNSQAQSTFRVLRARVNSPQQTDVEILGELNEAAILALDDEVHGKELWTSDGTLAGTNLLADLNPDAESSYPAGLSSINGLGIFSANTNTEGRELWRTDGTLSGTYMLSAINPGVEDGVSWDSESSVAGGYAYFVGMTKISGAELWRTDGTVAGTSLVKDILPGSSSSYPNNLTTMKDRLYFAVGSRLFTSDGSEQGTIELYNFGGARVTQILATADSIFITAGGALAVSNGTTAGTQIVRANEPGSEHVQGKLAASNNGIFYPGFDPAHGVELWYSDGTSVGTRIVADVSPGASSGLRYQVVSGGRTTLKNSAVFVSNSKILFTADDGISGPEIWIFDPIGISNIPGSNTPTPTPTTCTVAAYSPKCGCQSAESDFNTNSVPDCIDPAINSSPPRIKSARVKGRTLTLMLQKYTSVNYEVAITKIGKRKVTRQKISATPRVVFKNLTRGTWKATYRVIPTQNVKSGWSMESAIRVVK